MIAMRLDGRVVIITGGAQGLGRVYAQRLMSEGARVVVADINGPRAQTTAQGLGALAIKVDVANRGSVEAMVTHTVDTFGRLDVLVNNAALFGPRSEERRVGKGLRSRCGR